MLLVSSPQLCCPGLEGSPCRKRSKHMFTDAQMKSRHPSKLCPRGVPIGSDLSEIQIRRTWMKKTGASRVPPKYKVPQWASHLDLAKVVFCCQLPQGVGRVERIFTSKTAPGIYSISPFSSFSPYFTITGFQSCDSVSGIDGCNQNVARVNYKNLKY